MNFKKFFLATLGVFAFIFLYEMLVHGFLLMGLYEASAGVWRDFKEMEANMTMAMGFQLALSAWVAFVFSQWRPEGGAKNGLLFGLYFGVFAGILTASWYLWLNVPAALSLGWFLSGIFEGLGSGLILGLIYRRNKA